MENSVSILVKFRLNPLTLLVLLQNAKILSPLLRQIYRRSIRVVLRIQLLNHRTTGKYQATLLTQDVLCAEEHQITDFPAHALNALFLQVRDKCRHDLNLNVHLKHLTSPAFPALNE